MGGQGGRERVTDSPGDSVSHILVSITASAFGRSSFALPIPSCLPRPAHHFRAPFDLHIKEAEAAREREPRVSSHLGSCPYPTFMRAPSSLSETDEGEPTLNTQDQAFSIPSQLGSDRGELHASLSCKIPLLNSFLNEPHLRVTKLTTTDPGL